MAADTSFALFLIGSILLIVAPGPDFAFVMTHGLAYGRRSGVFAAFGISLGLLTHTLLAAVGLTALLISSSTIFELIKIIGAAYLFYLGCRALFSKQAPIVEAAPRPETASDWRILRAAMLTNVFNPKALLTFM